MLSISDYDVYIFDCDGVILDSNQLKIDAMEKTLCTIFTDKSKIDQCVDYFRNNFGKSRFHHVDVFIEKYLLISEKDINDFKLRILKNYSSQCKKLYLSASITPGFTQFITALKGKKYIASGSEQNELREVFKVRMLDVYFDGIYGSPLKKADLISNILKQNKPGNAIMFGDAISDLESTIGNKVDFCAYIPFSNVAENLTVETLKRGYQVIDGWGELNY